MKTKLQETKEEKRERILKEYQERYGEHHPLCTCPNCLELRKVEPILKTLWRFFIFGTAAKTPRNYPRRYLCPKCLGASLDYEDKEGIFICRNKTCGKKYMLIEYRG